MDSEWTLTGSTTMGCRSSIRQMSGLLATVKRRIMLLKANRRREEDEQRAKQDEELRGIGAANVALGRQARERERQRES